MIEPAPITGASEDVNRTELEVRLEDGGEDGGLLDDGDTLEDEVLLEDGGTLDEENLLEDGGLLDDGGTLDEGDLVDDGALLDERAELGGSAPMQTLSEKVYRLRRFLLKLFCLR